MANLEINNVVVELCEIGNSTNELTELVEFD